MEVNMVEVTTLGIDLAKNVFQIHGVNRAGRCIYKRRVMRDQLILVIAQLPSCLIGIEACTGAFYWQRRFEEYGHTVKVMAPQYVRPFGRGQKNDGNDAEAICTAVQQPNMRFVPGKSTEQQDIQALHRARQRLVNHRTALISQMRGLLLERGVAIAKSVSRAQKLIPQIIADPGAGLTDITRETIGTLYDFLLQINEKIKFFDGKINTVFRTSPVCQRLAKVSGVGPKTATAIVAAVGDGSDFKNGRHMAAWMGLVPRQHSSGDRQVLMGISKRGDKNLRTLLVHGGRAVVRTASRKTDPRSQWVNQLRGRRGYNRAAVAVANKNARIIWALLRHGDEYHALT